MAELKHAPIKRHEALKPLSRDQHHNLLLCWKIREGRKKGIPAERMKTYTDYFFSSQIKPHFEFEEQEVFNLLGEDHPLIKRAKKEHVRLQKLFAKQENLDGALAAIEVELDDHVRFEERVLFKALQEEVPTLLLDKIKNKEEEIITPDPDDWDDKFWNR